MAGTYDCGVRSRVGTRLARPVHPGYPTPAAKVGKGGIPPGLQVPLACRLGKPGAPAFIVAVARRRYFWMALNVLFTILQVDFFKIAIAKPTHSKKSRKVIYLFKKYQSLYSARVARGIARELKV